jgi:hypothetical protein
MKQKRFHICEYCGNYIKSKTWVRRKIYYNREIDVRDRLYKYYHPICFKWVDYEQYLRVEEKRKIEEKREKDRKRQRKKRNI